MLKFAACLNSRNCLQVSKRFCSSNKNIIVEKLTGKYEKIAFIGMQKHSTKNALGLTFSDDLSSAIQEVRHDSSIWAVILRSLVPGVFCAGIDLKDTPKLNDDDFAAMVNQVRSTFTELENLPIPVIAAIDGVAIGGGMEATLPCDLRIAASNVKMGQVETKLSLFPAAGGSQRLPRLIGPGRAKQLILTGSMIDANFAEKIGLVQYVVPQNESGDAAYLKSLEVASELVSNGPLGIRMSKLAIDKGLQVDITTGMKIEEECLKQFRNSKDVREGLKAAIERRKPIYKGE